MKPLSIWAGALGLASIAAAVGALADDRNVTRQSAEAAASKELRLPGDPQRVEFEFGNGTAWLNSDGHWSMEAKISHQGLVCATYQVGLRFGAGAPGCTDVLWLGVAKMGDQKKQCNSSEAVHVVGDIDPDKLKTRFNEVTCAERVVTCSGNCK